MILSRNTSAGPWAPVDPQDDPRFRCAFPQVRRRGIAREPDADK